jgi:D-aspartate ligase
VPDEPDSPAVILGCYAHGGLAVARSLGRLGVPVYCVDADWATPAFFSRYCRGRARWDLPNATQEQTLDMLHALGKRIGRPAILIPTGDMGAIFVADHASDLRERYFFPDVDPALVRKLCSKREMSRLATAHGVATPAAVFPKSRADVLDYMDVAQFPIIIKPIFGNIAGRVVKPIVRFETRDALLAYYDANEDTSRPNLMLQEFIPGGDDQTWVFNGYFDQTSICRLGITGRKVRNYPPGFGQASSGLCTPNPEVEQTTIRFMREIGYRGCLDIGYRFDSRDGRYKVNDINPRIGAMFRCFVGQNGMDVARALYQDMTSNQVSPTMPKAGHRWRVENNDIYSSIHYWRHGRLSFKQWHQSTIETAELSYVAADDLMPVAAAVLVDVRYLLMKAMAKARRWIGTEGRRASVRPAYRFRRKHVTRVHSE